MIKATLSELLRIVRQYFQMKNGNVITAGKCFLMSGFFGICLLIASCATPYQPMGALGGYQEEQLAPDIYRVAFFGNGYTAPQTAADYVIHRCAELTEQRGYRYFGILAVSDQSVARTFTTPAHAYTTGTGYANVIEIRPSEPTTPPLTTRRHKRSNSIFQGQLSPSRWLTIGLKERT